MTNSDTPPPDRNAPGVGAYSLWCMASLVVMTAGVLSRRADLWMLAPAFLGGVSLLFRWRLSPVIVLCTLVLLYVSGWYGVSPLQSAWNNTFGLILSLFTRGRWLLHDRPLYMTHEASPIADLLTALGYLAFAAGNYRLLGMTARIFPREARRRHAPSADRRPALPITRGEVQAFVVALLGCVTLAAILGAWSDDPDSSWNRAALFGDWKPLWTGSISWPLLLLLWLIELLTYLLTTLLGSWQFLLLLWLIGVMSIVIAGVLRTLAARRMTGEEALVLLQDIFWAETRGEQRRLNRWLSWSWLRRRRREDRT